MATVANSVEPLDQLLSQAVKATQEKASYLQLRTPESSPEPGIRELPKDTDNDNEKQDRLINLINHIQNDGDNPYNILEVKSSDDFNSRTPRLLKVLEEAEAKKVDGATSALEKARNAEKTLKVFFDQCQKEVNRILDEKDSSHDIVLQSDKGTPDERYKQLATFVNPVVFKGKGVDDALKVLNQALADATAEDTTMKDDDMHVQPDAETISLYKEATPIVLQYLRDVRLDATNITGDLEEINQKISAHNASLGDEHKMLMINTRALYSYIQESRPDLKLLKNDLQDEQARARLKKIQAELLQFDKDHHYPTSWVLSIPGASSLEEMLGRAPVSTVMGLECAPGATFDGGKILRYNEFFVKRVKNERGEDTDEIESAVYNFLVENEGRFYIKSGKDIGKAAATAYVAKENENKFKMGTYYGEKKYGIKYTKSFFKDLQKLEKETGERYLYFLGAARKSFETKSRRTMPPEHCVVGIKHPGTNEEWYDVFTKSKLVQLYGDDIKKRISEYWKDVGERPSEKSPVAKDGKDTGNSSDAAANATTGQAMGALQESVEQLSRKVQSMEGTLDRVSRLEDIMTTLAANMNQLTVSVKALEDEKEL